jgi:hypothetical protein
LIGGRFLAVRAVAGAIHGCYAPAGGIRSGSVTPRSRGARRLARDPSRYILKSEFYSEN